MYVAYEMMVDRTMAMRLNKKKEKMKARVSVRVRACAGREESADTRRRPR